MDTQPSFATPQRWNSGKTPTSKATGVASSGGTAKLESMRTTATDRIEAALKSDQRVQGVKVSAVGRGVVRLETKGASLEEQLRAIELAWAVAGVASEG